MFVIILILLLLVIGFTFYQIGYNAAEKQNNNDLEEIYKEEEKLKEKVLELQEILSQKD